MQSSTEHQSAPRLPDLTDASLAIDGRIAVLTFQRHDVRNALTGTALVDDIVATVAWANSNPEVSVLILTGDGSAFCSGGNVKEMQSRTGSFAGSPVELQDRYRHGIQRLPLALHGAELPVIAAVNGPAVGVGASMTLAMDARFAAPSASFGFVFTRLGIVPEACSSWFLPRLVGLPIALDWLMSGRRVSADDALAYGLAQHLADDVVTAATGYARDLVAGTAPVSVALTRQLVWRMITVATPAEAHRVDSALLLAAAAAPDAREGVAAFRERRAPDFAMRTPEDLPAAYPWWEPDQEWST